jgi:anaphase-promoting complex subunit 2
MADESPWSDLNRPEIRAARTKVLSMAGRLEEVGLGGEWGQRVLAEVIDACITEFIHKAYKAQWTSPSTVPSSLRQWVETSLTRLIADVHCAVRDGNDPASVGSTSEDGGGQSSIIEDDADRWVEVGISRLGRMRVEQLFDIVVDWDASKGAIEDLKVCRRQSVEDSIPLILTTTS